MRNYMLLGLAGANILSLAFNLGTSQLFNHRLVQMDNLSVYVQDVNQDNIADVVLESDKGNRTAYLGKQDGTFENFVNQYEAKKDSIESRLYEVK